MNRPRCPGQDLRYWTPEDIFQVECPYCSNEIEFWKDEPVRTCRKCGNEVNNPQIDLGCAAWCKFAKECLGGLPGEARATGLANRALALLSKQVSPRSAAFVAAKKSHDAINPLLEEKIGEPILMRLTALITAFLRAFDDTDELILSETKARQEWVNNFLCELDVDEEITPLIQSSVESILSDGDELTPEAVAIAEFLGTL